jgi:hypothetical protein
MAQGDVAEEEAVAFVTKVETRLSGGADGWWGRTRVERSLCRVTSVVSGPKKRFPVF